MLKVKKIFSTFVGVAMAANAFITMPISAFADEETSHTYTYDGYEVSYDVTNAWGNTEVVSVTLSNTGDSAIENWMLYFEPNGQVHSTVNVQEAQTSTGTTYFRNSGYNANINPDSSVSFCYMVDDCEAVPDNFTLCQTREEKESGYEVSLKVNQTWGDSFNGEIIIQNNTDKPIESWELTVDTNFTITEITNSWAATVKELEPYSYMLKGTYTGTVYPNSSVSLGFNGVKSGEPTITDYSLTEVVADENLIASADNYLTSSVKEILVGKDSSEVYFYLNSLETDTNITLYENDIPVAVFYDDGNYAAHGDDIQGDGIYSVKYNVDINTDIDSSNVYYAKSDNNFASNEISVDLIIPFTEKELSDMAYVDDAISAVINDNSYQSSTIDERKESMVDLLNELDINNKIVEDSIEIDEKNSILSFKYTRDVVGDILLEEFDDETDGIDLTDSIMPSVDAVNLSTTTQPLSQVNVAILNSFENIPFRTDYYESLVSDWTEQGLNVYYDDTVTVNDLKTALLNKQIISLSGHGTIERFCLNGEDEIANSEKDQEYETDILKGRIVKSYNYGKTYFIKPEFFSYYYDKGSLDGSFIFGNSCSLMGHGEKINEAFANAFLGASAEGFVGYCNNVESGYSRNVMRSYFEALMTGVTSAEALDMSVSEHGEHCYCGAYPVLRGDPNAILIGTDIENGDFEGYTQKYVSTPLSWKCTGDVRVLSKLGDDIIPYDSRMAFLSTGIGSKEESYISGTQGSSMSQIVKVGSYSTLSFNYDVVSEEPEEWVGSIYNDKFEIQILDENDNILSSEIIEAVNTSTWYSVSGINFDGGDDTVYHTGWATKTIDISNYQNKIIQVRFLVYDVGDSIYDTATVLDNIRLN